MSHRSRVKNMQEWRNWQTRTVQVRVSIALMRVQVPFPAFLMKEDKLIAYRFIFFRFAKIREYPDSCGSQSVRRGDAVRKGGTMRLEEIQIEIIRSRRKTMALEITPQCAVRVRAPLGMPEEEIRRFVQEKSDWILKHLAVMEKKAGELKEIRPMSAEELEALADRACQVIPERVRYFAPKVGVDYGMITIRNQKTRWGSCSARGNLNFNCLLMLAPPEVIDYVVVHELCHRKELNHSPRFWAEVARVLPDYKRQERWLKENGKRLMARNVK